MTRGFNSAIRSPTLAGAPARLAVTRFAVIDIEPVAYPPATRTNAARAATGLIMMISPVFKTQTKTISRLLPEDLCGRIGYRFLFSKPTAFYSLPATIQAPRGLATSKYYFAHRSGKWPMRGFQRFIINFCRDTMSQTARRRIGLRGAAAH
jgi:hypothetical protein